MNKQIMIKHYEATPKETLIDILVASREQVDKLQKRNKELKQEIERLNNIINKAIEYIEEQSKFVEGCDIYQICNKEVLLKILKGSDKE